MKKFILLLSVLVLGIVLSACADAGESGAKIAPADVSPPPQETPPPPETPRPNVPPESMITMMLTSDDMRQFEAEHAASAEQARALAFGAYILTTNRESSRVFPLFHSANQAAQLLSSGWGIVDGESALRQLRLLAAADGQSPVANDILHTFARGGRFEPLDALDLLIEGLALAGIEELFAASVRRAEQSADEFEILVQVLEMSGIEMEREEFFDLFIMMQLTDRVNSGMEAYQIARDLLMAAFDYTEEELQGITSLAAWDYGRAAFIARYSVAAGYLEEADVWEYLMTAADSAAAIYSSWREYTAAYILGRALAFGNNSVDMIPAIDFLLNHEESPFFTVNFR